MVPIKSTLFVLSLIFYLPLMGSTADNAQYGAKQPVLYSDKALAPYANVLGRHTYEGEPIKQVVYVNQSPPKYYANQIKFRLAGFFPFNKRFREVYGDVGISYEIEAATQLNDPYQAWINFNWMSESGKVKGPKNHTNINIGSLSFGINVQRRISCACMVYLGIGPSIACFNVADKSICGSQRTLNVKFGGIIKSGFQYTVCNKIVSELFVDFLYQPLKHQCNVTGIKAGIGFGYKF